MKIQDAIARLQRAGDENSKATKKLHEAARNVADLIEQNAPVNVTLPRGYKVLRYKSNVGSQLFLKSGHTDEYGDGDMVDGCGCYLHGDFNCWIPAQTRECSLQFARDVAEGLLDEIAAFIEARKTESEKAAETLNVKLS